MHNWIMQVFWPEKGAAGEDTAGAGMVGWNTFTLHGNSINMFRVFI